jgi:hypothetical protein
LDEIAAMTDSERCAKEPALLEVKGMVSTAWSVCKSDQRVAVRLASLNDLEEKMHASKRDGTLQETLGSVVVTEPTTVLALEDVLKRLNPMHVEPAKKQAVYNVITQLIETDAFVLPDDSAHSDVVVRQIKQFQRFVGSSAASAVGVAIDCRKHLADVVTHSNTALAKIDVIVDFSKEVGARNLAQALDRSIQQMGNSIKQLSADYKNVSTTATAELARATTTASAFCNAFVNALLGSMRTDVAATNKTIDDDGAIQGWVSASRDAGSFEELLKMYKDTLLETNVDTLTAALGALVEALCKRSTVFR